MTDLIASYGQAVVAWVLVGLGTLLSTYVFSRMRAGYVRDVLDRAWQEVKGAVLEVTQTYTDELRRGRADGVLTEAEKTQARQRAVDIAKTNIGTKGLRRLGRVIGFDVDSWLGSKTEQAVAEVKALTEKPALIVAPPVAGTPPAFPRRPA